MRSTILVLSLLALSSCNSQQGGFEQLPVERVVLKLENTGHRRSFDQNDYSLHYRSVPPNRVVIVVQHLPNTDQQRLKAVIESARGVVRKFGEDFGLKDIETEVEMRRLERKPE